MPIQEANSIFQPGESTNVISFGPVPTGREWHIEWVSIYCDSVFPTAFQLVAAPAREQVANSNYIASTLWGNSDYARFFPALIVQQAFWLFGAWALGSYTINGLDPRRNPASQITGSWRIQYADVPLDERYIVPELEEA